MVASHTKTCALPLLGKASWTERGSISCTKGGRIQTRKLLFTSGMMETGHLYMLFFIVTLVSYVQLHGLFSAKDLGRYHFVSPSKMAQP